MFPLDKHLCAAYHLAPPSLRTISHLSRHLHDIGHQCKQMNRDLRKLRQEVTQLHVANWENLDKLRRMADMRSHPNAHRKCDVDAVFDLQCEHVNPRLAIPKQDDSMRELASPSDEALDDPRAIMSDASMSKKESGKTNPAGGSHVAPCSECKSTSPLGGSLAEEWVMHDEESGRLESDARSCLGFVGSSDLSEDFCVDQDLSDPARFPACAKLMKIAREHRRSRSYRSEPAFVDAAIAWSDQNLFEPLSLPGAVGSNYVQPLRSPIRVREVPQQIPLEESPIWRPFAATNHRPCFRVGAKQCTAPGVCRGICPSQGLRVPRDSAMPLRRRVVTDFDSDGKFPFVLSRQGNCGQAGVFKRVDEAIFDPDDVFAPAVSSPLRGSTTNLDRQDRGYSHARAQTFLRRSIALLDRQERGYSHARVQTFPLRKRRKMVPYRRRQAHKRV